MHIESVYINGFRNLNDFRIDFSEMKTVLIGQNASGKSNFIEAIVLIFKQLDFPNNIKKEHWFEYEIIYTLYENIKAKSKRVKITRKLEKSEYKVFNGNKDAFDEDIYVPIKDFKKDKESYLPKYIFAYYSGLGNSNRLEEHFEDYKRSFATKAIEPNRNTLPEPPRMLYAELIHSQLSLFSFFIDDNIEAKNFLKEHLNIDGLQSILLTIYEPSWTSPAKKEKDPKFFGSEGVVKSLLYHLHDNVAFAPFRSKEENKSGLWEKKGKKGIETVYLYINDFQKIRDYVKDNKWSAFQFFHVLNTANVSQLLTKEGIKIRVKKQFAGKVAFKDLSEGEQQLLTVLGLMRFTKTEETLFLLDEPDTHLNPLWRWKYMDFIDQIVINNDDKTKVKIANEPSIQVIMSSHDPLTIGGLTKEAVRIFYKDSETGQIEVSPPIEDPKGMGAAGILTDIFGLPSTLDPELYNEIERRKNIESELNFGKNLSEIRKVQLQNELISSNEKLDNLGYYRITTDPLYQKFQKAVLNNPIFKKVENRVFTPEEIEAQYRVAEEILKQILKDENP